MHISICGTPREIAMLIECLRNGDQSESTADAELFKIGKPTVSVKDGDIEVR